MITKKKLRSILLPRRNQIPLELRRTKAAAAAQLALSKLENRHTVAVYNALASEIDPSNVVSTLRQTNTIIVYPRVVAQRSTIEFCVITDSAQLQPGHFRVLEPCAALPPIPISAIDAFILPGLAFDKAGNRLGWGQGYYDRALAQNPHALRMGLCFHEQIETSVPCDPYDQTMDWVVSDLEIHAGPRRPDVSHANGQKEQA